MCIHAGSNVYSCISCGPDLSSFSSKPVLCMSQNILDIYKPATEGVAN